MTLTHPGIPEELRGTYAGWPIPRSSTTWKSLECDRLELMPVHQFMHDHRLVDMGLRNYWGYNTLDSSPPQPVRRHPACGGAVAEFKTMVRLLHEAGIEVILDVVFTTTPPKATTSGPRSFPGYRQRRLLPPLDTDLRY